MRNGLKSVLLFFIIVIISFSCTKKNDNTAALQQMSPEAIALGFADQAAYEEWAAAQASVTNTAEGKTWTVGNITAALNGNMLTISGTGSITGEDEGGGHTYYPWNHLAEITTVVIEDGITEIGFQAFYFAYGLTNAVIPGSVTTIKSYAFARKSEMDTIIIPANVKKIEAYAFYDSPLTSITLGANVELGEWAGGGDNQYYAPSFDNGFDEFYTESEKLEGTYFYENGAWRKAAGVG